MNRRVAAHLNRKGDSGGDFGGAPQTEAARPSASRRAAEAAARVAARYAHAPSYSEMLAGEARAALRAAEAATRAAHHAREAAASVLAGIEAATRAEAIAEPRTAHPERQAAPQRTPAEPTFAVRWDPELPVRHTAPAETVEIHGQGAMEAGLGGWRGQAQPEQDASGEEAIEVVEPSQPIHANLIEFPRELVAPRKARARRAEEHYGEAEPQLSIFEVDPASVSIQPEAAAGNAAVLYEAGIDVAAAPVWAGPEWSNIELDAQPEEEEFEEPETRSAQAPEVHLAPMGLRLMALVVDGALIVAALVASATAAARNMAELPGMRTVEVGAALALLAAGAAYLVVFYTLGRATPGMKYAHIRLCTFDGYSPNCAQRTGRLAAMLLSVLPVGLGIAWALFDEDHLSWHDRLSRTYLRRY